MNRQQEFRKQTEEAKLEAFSLMCKKVAELEAQIEELKEKLKEKLKTIADKDLSFVAKFDALEKENAELKERLKEHESIGNAQFWRNVWSWKTEAEQLTKVKVALRKVVDYLGQFCSDYLDCVIEAEQFLKDNA